MIPIEFSMEDDPDNVIEAREWPAVPRVGDIVGLFPNYEHGRVTRVEWVDIDHEDRRYRQFGVQVYLDPQP
jgi:hypothetical protein